MYYDRTLSDKFAKYLLPGGKLRWLFDFVKTRSDLDLSLVVTEKNGKKEERIILYRGLTKVIDIYKRKGPERVYIDGADTYKELTHKLYGSKVISDISPDEIEIIIDYLRKKGEKDRYYGNKKEGYYQNELSRKYGIYATDDEEFVIVDKEAVVGYDDEDEKEKEFKPIREKYHIIQKKISNGNPKSYGSKRGNESLGNELDFLALNKKGDICLIELKHGTNTSGIYLSPLQIGLYYDIFDKFSDLQESVLRMLKQKQEMGLINPNWEVPEFSGKIVPVLIVAEPNHRSSAKEKFYGVLKICRENLGDDFLKNIKMYDYTMDKGLVSWDRQ